VSHTIDRSDFAEVVKHNRDFRENYGLIIGACLYALSLKTARGRSFPWISAFLAIFAVALGWLKHQW
jgi:hypothetical protein